jgi:hypothetical protein
MHHGVERLPIRAPGRFYEYGICKVLDGRKFRAEKIEVARTREPRRRVALLDQSFNRDRVGSLGLFVE